MNHLTNNLDEHLNEHFSEREIEDETMCFFCLHPVEAEDIKHLNVIGKRIDCCEDCYEFQTSNK